RGEIIIYKSVETLMVTEPLSQYLRKRFFLFEKKSTACWRGYFGKWEIKENKLYLIHLEANVRRKGMVGLDYLFEGKDEVFANWFSGDIRIPKGEIMVYVHMGYDTIYEGELILTFEDGILIDEKEIDNREKYKEEQIEWRK